MLATVAWRNVFDLSFGNASFRIPYPDDYVARGIANRLHLNDHANEEEGSDEMRACAISTCHSYCVTNTYADVDLARPRNRSRPFGKAAILRSATLRFNIQNPQSG
jgi:hypothetical protein